MKEDAELGTAAGGAIYLYCRRLHLARGQLVDLGVEDRPTPFEFQVRSDHFL